MKWSSDLMVQKTGMMICPQPLLWPCTLWNRPVPVRVFRYLPFHGSDLLFSAFYWPPRRMISSLKTGRHLSWGPLGDTFRYGFATPSRWDPTQTLKPRNPENINWICFYLVERFWDVRSERLTRTVIDGGILNFASGTILDTKSSASYKLWLLESRAS